MNRLTPGKPLFTANLFFDFEEGTVSAPSGGVALSRVGVGVAWTVFPSQVASAAEGRPATARTRLFTRWHLRTDP